MASERRKAPRFSKFLAVAVGGVQLQTSNLSATGIQVACPALRLRRLKDVLDSKQMRATMTLPDGESVQVLARVAYVSEYDDEYLIGADFESFDGDGKARWLEYVSTGTR